MKNLFLGRNPSIVSPAKMEIFENRKIIADGKFEIKEYENTKLCIDSGKTVLTVEGCDIEIGEFTSEFIEISGIISAVKFG